VSSKYGREDVLMRTKKRFKSTTKALSRKDRKGIALALSGTMIILLSVIGIGMLRVGLSARVRAAKTTAEIAARAAADAGFSRAVFELNNVLGSEQGHQWSSESLFYNMAYNNNWNISSNRSISSSMVTLPAADAEYKFTIQEVIEGSLYNVTSTGWSGWAQKTISSTVRLAGPFESAIHTKEDLILDNSAAVDWYNYGNDGSSNRVSTNSKMPGAVSMANSATIKGDVCVGEGGDPDEVIELKSDATITGSTGSMADKWEPPSVTVPQWLQSSPSGGTIKNSTTINSSGKYDGIDLGNGKGIQIEGDVVLYIEGDVTLGNSAEIQIDKNSSLIMYVSGNFEEKNSSTLNNQTADPKKLQIRGLDTCKSMRFKNSSTLYGTVYAPDAEVILDNSADTYGAVVGKRFEQKNSATFYYDASLKDTSQETPGSHFVVGRWSER
jgi:hypothetical protein